MNRERRAVLRGVATLTGVAVGCGTNVGASTTADEKDENRRNNGDENRRGDDDESQQNRNDENRQDGDAKDQGIDTSLPPGVTLFDLDGDGAFTATVERAPAEMQDDDHPEPIHVTSQGRETADFAASVVQPDGAVTLGDVSRLTYDYYEGPDNAGGEGRAGAVAPGQTFVVVENDDGRHGAYLTYDPNATRPREEWLTEDVLARLRGDTAGTSGWFEYTEIEADYDGETFDDFVGRFGEEARLSRVGVGLGSAANPSTLDVYYDTLSIGDATRRFPTTVANRVSNENPL